MKFVLEVYAGMIEERYRLQQYNSWRSLPSHFSRNYPQFNPNDSYELSDQIFDSLESIHPYMFEEGKVNCNGKEYRIHKGDYVIPELEPTAFFHPKVKRETKPHHFTKAELKEVIAADNDDYHNSLVLTLNGHFELWTPQDARKLLSPVAVRYESFVAGNEYVGKQAALDNGFINQTYLAMLEGWVTHLMNFELDIYQDYSAGKKTESQLWAEVDKITTHLR